MCVIQPCPVLILNFTKLDKNGVILEIFIQHYKYIIGVVSV